MTIIELSTTTTTTTTSSKPDLLIHSPVFLDGPLRNAVDRLGTVRHIISPNYEHVKYAKMWGEAYADAYMWGCPGLAEREPDVRWSGELPYGCRPPGYGSAAECPEGMWDWNDVQPFHVDVEVNPFTGNAFFNEVVFYHSASNTLLTTDTYWNYPKGDGITNSNYGSLKERLRVTTGRSDNGVSGDEDFGVWELAPEVENVPLTSR